MNLKRARSLIIKVNHLYETISETPDNIPNIEKDLMLQYLRELYEVFHQDNYRPTAETPKQSPPPPPPIKIVEPPAVPKSVIKETPKVVKPTPVVKKEEKPTPVVEVTQPVKEPTPSIEPPVYVQKEIEPTPTPKPKPIEVVKPQPKPEPKVVYAPPPTKNVVSEGIYSELFEAKRVTDLSERLSATPIKDLKNAMGINERFLNISELFGGNAIAYNDTINILNELTDFNSAKAYIIEALAPKYDWLDDRRINLAKSFIKKVKRRYQS